MTPTIVINEKEFPAFHWMEVRAGNDADAGQEDHNRGEKLLHEGVSELHPGEVYFQADQTFAFDTTFTLKGDGRKFVIIASDAGKHVAKPY